MPRTKPIRSWPMMVAVLLAASAAPAAAQWRETAPWAAENAAANPRFASFAAAPPATRGAVIGAVVGAALATAFFLAAAERGDSLMDEPGLLVGATAAGALIGFAIDVE